MLGAKRWKEQDVFGDHQAACMLSGLPQMRAKPLEKMFARVLKEGGAKVLERQKVRDLKIPGISASDDRWIEIVATGLPMYRNTPIACDVTIASPLTGKGDARPRAAWEDGVAIRKAEREHERTYHELVNSSRCRLVVLACEVGGRWSETCLQLIHDLAEFRSRQAPPRLRRSTALAWENRWWGMLSVAMQDSLAATLVNDAPHLVHGWHGTDPPLGQLLHREAPSESRLPMRGA